MGKYRKKPVEIEAVEVDAMNMRAVHEFCPAFTSVQLPGILGYINTLEGQMFVSEGDWIIKGVAGEFYPCKWQIFEQTYESA